MPFAVVYDACVLYPNALRDLLIRTARSGIVQARWSEQILDECFRSIQQNIPHISDTALARTRQLMTMALPAANIVGYESLIAGIALPDADDRHVLAAAIRSGAQAIVTFNLGDFPADVLARYDIEPKHPDEFMMNCIDISAATVMQVVTEQAGDLHRPPMSVDELLGVLRARGLVQSVARLNDLRAGIFPAGFPLPPDAR